ncbi:MULTISPECIES: hypothetical protein [unclassified Microbacterium]|uniref:hypothetical protein n=1 Tax=unclassified Microbacterium TaxID=2609290 RepID=UPI0038708202
MRDDSARGPYLLGRGVEVLGALLVGAALWLIAASPAVIGWIAALVGVSLFVMGRWQSLRAWEHLPALRRTSPEPGWLTVLAGGVSIAAVAAGAVVGAAYGPLSAVIAVMLGAAGMYFGYRNLQADPKGAERVMSAVLLVAGVGVATLAIQALLF